MRLSEAIKVGVGNSGGGLSGFMQDLHDMTADHPFNRRARIFDGGVIIEAEPFGGSIHIGDIQTMQPRSGKGTKAVKFLIELANKHKVALELNAKAYAQDSKFMDTEQLVRWYMRLGFKITDGTDPSDIWEDEHAEMKYFPR